MVEKICVVGLGYVGLPLACLLAKKYKVIGYDKNQDRIEELKRGVDSTREVLPESLNNPNLEFTEDEKRISECDFVIVAVPTPVDKVKNPDLSYLRDASRVVGKNLKKGAIVVYESTVYPGATEEICVPILEKESGLKWKEDFWVGYSPERVNPGDKEHTIEKIVKVVAGDTEYSLEKIAEVYGSVIGAGIYKAPSIRVAEAAKVIENTQRDINIALMNELAIIFDKMGIDTREVLKAAYTKWNFLRFEPGLVGGHCIPVDPYYLAYKSMEIGHVPELILAGRNINESIPSYIAYKTLKLMIKGGKSIANAKVLVMGITFKENVPDIRNSKSYDLVRELKELGLNVFVYDPVAYPEEVKKEYGIELIKNIDEFAPYDCVIVSVKHNEFRNYSKEIFKNIMKAPYIFIDVRSCFEEFKKDKDFIYWAL
ncbi:nucleotide sugar dehydrogenase [Thermodesulfovibrio sp. 3907-1M]|uniref:Nucleotide sugar dehydrogenase n=1 Tax=Thermodesulfovibrio autotrophicus TaxID=3118333 RepID=A0AAU8GWX9_9BACT